MAESLGSAVVYQIKVWVSTTREAIKCHGEGRRSRSHDGPHRSPSGNLEVEMCQESVSTFTGGGFSLACRVSTNDMSSASFAWGRVRIASRMDCSRVMTAQFIILPEFVNVNDRQQHRGTARVSI